MSFDSYFGDEELEEGMTLHDPTVPTPRVAEHGERRLSRTSKLGSEMIATTMRKTAGSNRGLHELNDYI